MCGEINSCTMFSSPKSIARRTGSSARGHLQVRRHADAEFERAVDG